MINDLIDEMPSIKEKKLRMLKEMRELYDKYKRISKLKRSEIEKMSF